MIYKRKANRQKAVDRLNAGTVDGIVINFDSAQAYIKTYPDLTVVDFPDGKGFQLDFNGICIGMRKEDTELLAKVNEELAGISTQTRQTLMDSATEQAGQ